MATSQKPAIIIVHGAWHRPVHYLGLVNALKARGYEVNVPALATAGWQPSVSNASIVDDAAVIQKALGQYTAIGREVILICHSYGGIPSTMAAVGNTISDRLAAGHGGGIKGVIYIAAFAVPARGMSLVNIAGMASLNEHPDWWSHKGPLAFLEPDACGRLYSGIGEDVSRICMDSTVPHSLAAFVDPCTNSGQEIAAPQVFIGCRDDLIMPFEGQKAMAAAVGARFIDIDSGHSPFLENERISDVVGIVEEIA
ncbi:Alpha/beta hydrolase fold-1 [Stachybotrys elegans]|uniref:Alpha/beta hydrolase fold-1 n=1 Tax=Stachybotrys elegans TaxID=80388 RepID=A0A8K0WJV4_9HYPO|nr:Alpha/beta hydrolase fold-1 [Stachybotrys elegans]